MKKKKKTSSPSTVKRLLAVDLSSRKVAALLLTCATVASKRSLFVFTPLVFGVAYNVIDFFFDLSSTRFFSAPHALDSTFSSEDKEPDPLS